MYKRQIPFVFEGTKNQRNELSKIIKNEDLYLQEGGRVINLTDKVNIAIALRIVAGTVALARTNQKNTEDSQFFILLVDAPLYQGEYSPVGKVIFGLDVLRKIKFDEKVINFKKKINAKNSKTIFWGCFK